MRRMARFASRAQTLFLISLIASFTVIFLTSTIPKAHASTTLTLQIQQGTDDCWKGYSSATLSWYFYTNKMDDEAGYWTGTDYMEGGGYRFQNVTIPNGAVITSAYMQYYFGYYGINLTNTCHNKIRGEDADNATTFSSAIDFDGRTRTTAVLDWSNIPSWYAGTWYNSPDISNIVQEIVNRAGWTSGNSMVMFRDDFDDRTPHLDYSARECYAYERGAATAPKLVITYETASGPIVPETPSVSTTGIGLNATFTCRWGTNGTLDKQIFSWNFTGSWVNQTAVAFVESNSTTIMSLGSNTSRVGEVIGWRFYGNTTTGTAAVTDVQNLTLTLPTNPFIIHGPYYETGAVAPVEENVTLHYTNGDIQVFLLNGTGGTATTFLFEPTYTPAYFSWPISGMNYTRTYDLTGLTTAEINVYLPTAGSTPQIYQFTITDYSGMTNPYISTAKTINSTTQYIERKAITVGTVSFLMEQWTTYSIGFSCTQGSYSNAFSAENSFYTNLNVAPLMFAQTNITSGYSALAIAYNSTDIRSTYIDTDNETTELTITIIEGAGNNAVIYYNTTIANFNGTYPSGLYVLDWNSRDSTKDYSVSLLTNRSGQLYQWVFPILAVRTNPFTGAFSFLGDWPNGVDPAQVISGIIIILAGVGIFSYMGTAAGCAFSWVMAGIMAFVGWFNLSIPLFVFSGFITVLIYIEEAKKQVREI